MSDFSNDNNRFAPPKAELGPGDTSGNAMLAGRGARFGAAMLDGIIIMAIVFTIAAFSGGGFFSYMKDADPEGGSMSMYFAMFKTFLPGYIVVMALQAYFINKYAATIGKKIIGLRVVRADGSPANFTRLFFARGGSAIAMSLIPVIGGLVSLVDSVMIFRDSRQCLHDNIADTIVIRNKA